MEICRKADAEGKEERNTASLYELFEKARQGSLEARAFNMACIVHMALHNQALQR